MTELKKLRMEKRITQIQAAELTGISVRSYKSYENETGKSDSIKYKYLLDKMSSLNSIDETHGIVDLKYIKGKCEEVFVKYDINFCYLFGSYAKSTATELSDIDLVVSSDIKGLKFFSLVEDLRENLHKKVDVLDENQLKDNFEFVHEVLKYGIKIYG